MFASYLVIMVDTIITIDTDVTLTFYCHENQAIINRGTDSGEVLSHPYQKRKFENSLSRYLNPHFFVPISDKVGAIISTPTVVTTDHKNPLSIGTRVAVATSPVAHWFAGFVVTLNNAPRSSLRILRIGNRIGGCFIWLTLPSR